LEAPPDSKRACHSKALRRNSTTGRVRGAMGGFRLRTLAGMTLVARSAGTWRLRVPMLPLSRALLGLEKEKVVPYGT
jgi:hypothetical protein